MMWARILVCSRLSKIDGSDSFSPSSLSASSTAIGTASAINSSFTPSLTRIHHRKRFASVVAASFSSSSSASNGGEPDLYAVLGLARNATLTDIRKAYRHLALKYHPDVSKHSRAAELFKRIRHAYEILSDEVTRIQYDRVLRYREDNGSLFGEKQYQKVEFEDRVRAYRWAEMKRKMNRKRYGEEYNASDRNYSYRDTGEEAKERNLNQERGPFSEVLRSAFISLFLLHVFGSRLSLTFSTTMALFDPQLDAGYKIGYIIAMILSGTGGILLVLCLHFVSWVCGKKSSGTVTLILVAIWVGSNLARFSPLPQGALLTLLYMSMKFQSMK